MEPSDGSFNHPAMTPEVCCRFDSFAGDPARHSDFGEEPSVLLRRVAFIRVESVRLVRRWPSASADVREAADEAFERDDVRDVGSGESNHERNPTGVDQKMVFAASFPAIRGVRPREVPPFTARTLELSTIAR